MNVTDILGPLYRRPWLSRFRCWLKRRSGGRHVYRKGSQLCQLCGHVKVARK